MSGAFEEMAAALEAMGLPYAVGGSLASAAYGIARATQNVDLVVDLSPEEAFALADWVARAFSVDPG